MSFNLDAELSEIGRLIMSASFLAEVRREVSKIRDADAVVIDGRQHGSGEFEVVVKGSDIAMVARRIKCMPDIDVQRLADDAIGINSSRRGSRNG